MLSGSLATTRKISTWPPFSRRIKQTENEIVQMFRLPNSREEKLSFPMEGGCDSRNGHNARILDERFIRILKIFKWGPDAEKALEVLKMKVNARLVREVLKVDVEVNVKIQFFKWAGKRRNFEHDSTTYMALIRCLDEHGFTGELWKTIQDMIKSSCPIGPADLSEIVKILGKAKMVNKALSVFYHVKGRKCRPTASTYNSVILMLIQEGHHEKVHELYNEMCSEGCAQSFAKNMGLFGHKVGCLSILTRDIKQAAAVKSQLQHIAHSMYSSPPIHGILLVTMILSDPNMKEQWKKEMKTMANRIRAMRTTLCRNLEDLDSSFNWEHITNQVGMFCFSGLAPDQVRDIWRSYSIYI
ncbi:hypothetical protein AHAS_Ahas02G0214400 [Arachis hypogaea]